MNKKTGIFALIIFLMITATASAYLLRRFVPLKDQLKQGASGEVLIEKQDFMPGQRALGINVYGLKPNSVYSVWLANEEPNKQTYALGVDINYFRTDGSGNGRYVTTVSEYTIDWWRWRYIEVNLHPDNNPANTKDMIVALKGDLIYGYHS